MTISITKPTVGGSENTWGATVNTALDDVVDVLNGDTASTPDLTAGSWKVGGTAITSNAADLNIYLVQQRLASQALSLDIWTASPAQFRRRLHHHYSPLAALFFGAGLRQVSQAVGSCVTAAIQRQI